MPPEASPAFHFRREQEENPVSVEDIRQSIAIYTAIYIVSRFSTTPRTGMCPWEKTSEYDKLRMIASV